MVQALTDEDSSTQRSLSKKMSLIIGARRHLERGHEKYIMDTIQSHPAQVYFKVPSYQFIAPCSSLMFCGIDFCLGLLMMFECNFIDQSFYSSLLMFIIIIFITYSIDLFISMLIILMILLLLL